MGKDYVFWDCYFVVIRFVMNLVVIVSMGFLLVFFIFGRELCVLFDVVVDMKVIVDNDNFVLSIMFYFCRLLIVFLDVRDVYE